MRKVTLFLLTIVLVLSLSACGKSEAAKTVDDQISAIGAVTLESEPQILEAEAAVSGLAEEDRKQLDNTDSLSKARETYTALVLEAETVQVEDTIAAIGSVSLDSADAIAAARALYGKSRAEVQGGVSNVAELEAAENTLTELRVKQVTDIIDGIGAVTLESSLSIQAAQEAFFALSTEEAAKVANAAVLESAAAQLKDLKKEQGQALLAKMKVEEDKVRGISFYYPKEYPQYTDTRCFVLPYIGQEGNETWLRLVCNYTDADDWVFFKKITFAVDEARYYKNFDYYDIVRDNDTEVWEVADIDVYDADVELLWAIANSTETIVRFEGDEYSRDFTIKDSDKQAIRDVLTAYEVLK